MSFDTLRGAAEQLRDAFREDYERLRDPVKREEAQLKRKREERVQRIKNNAGL